MKQRKSKRSARDEKRWLAWLSLDEAEGGVEDAMDPLAMNRFTCPRAVQPARCDGPMTRVSRAARRKAKVDARNEMGAIRDIVRAQEVDDQFNVYAEACIDEYAQVSALISIIFCERRQETESKARASALAAATRVFTAFVSLGGQGPQAAADRAEEGDGPQLHEPPDQVVVLKKQHMCKSIY